MSQMSEMFGSSLSERLFFHYRLSVDFFFGESEKASETMRREERTVAAAGPDLEEAKKRARNFFSLVSTGGKW